MAALAGLAEKEKSAWAQTLMIVNTVRGALGGDPIRPWWEEAPRVPMPSAESIAQMTAQLAEWDARRAKDRKEIN